ncbi:MAG: 28S ribosomal protein S35, mitochondrial, partial [Marteilia pararefringens]
KGFELPYIKEDPLQGHLEEAVRYKKFRNRNCKISDSYDSSHNWADTWPNSSTYNHSICPLPLYQGYRVGMHNKLRKVAPPPAYGNLELMKIPNFLHLTPDHIKRHCEALKSLCTYLPKNSDPHTNQVTSDEVKQLLNDELPVELTSQDILYDSADFYHEISRRVRLTICVDRFNFNDSEKSKFVKLVGDRYDSETGVFTIEAEKCPTRQQNYDYAMYLLKVVYHECKKIAEWEKDDKKDLEDLDRFDWHKSQSITRIADIKSKGCKIRPEVEAAYKDSVSNLFHNPDLSDAEITYKESVKRIYTN